MKLDSSAALAVIDLQKGIVGMPTAHPAAEIVERAARLAQAFRARGMPVVLVNVTGGAPGRTNAGPRPIPSGSEWSELVPQLDQQASDRLITKQRWGAFHGTTLDAELRKAGVTQIVLAGISTSIGVESTARSAYDLGYHVALVADAMTDRSADAHKHSIETIFPRLGEVDTTDNVLRLLTE